MNANERDTGWRSHLFVGTNGHVLALDGRSGATLWKTSLPRTGWSVVAILVGEDVLHCAAGGRVFGLDPEDGSILWENDLPGMGKKLVYLASHGVAGAPELMTLLAQQHAEAQAHAAAALSLIHI